MKINDEIFNLMKHKFNSIINSGNYNVLEENKKFVNKYNGKRCFILGNGPSLNTVDFSVLKNEYVFTVNRLMRLDNFKNLNSNFHLYADLHAFGLRKGFDNDSKVILQEMLSLGKDVELFLPLEAEQIIRRNKYDKKLKINFFKIGSPFIKGNRNIDLMNTIPSFNTVVQYAIAIAIYMGFKEIYLLGCDGTIIKAVIDTLMNAKMYAIHAYDDNDGLQENAYKQLLNNYKMDYVLYDQYTVFYAYRLLNKYCKAKKIKLVNLCETSLIDSLPKENLNDILNH